MWYPNDMFHYKFKAENVTLVRSKVRSGPFFFSGPPATATTSSNSDHEDVQRDDPPCASDDVVEEVHDEDAELGG